MNILKINPCDVANGPGVRVSLFVSGCPHHCKGCFNPESWDYGAGVEMHTGHLAEIVEAMSHDYISGFTLLGGEPLSPEKRDTIRMIVVLLKTHFPDKSIWCYTGYTLEQVKDHPALPYIDVLVDGPFIEAEKDLSLRFRGSRNQRIIELHK